MKRCWLVIYFFLIFIQANAVGIVSDAEQLMAAGNYKKALEIYQELTALKKNNGDLYYKAGICALLLENEEEAEKSFLLAVEKRYYRTYYKLAELYRKQYRFQESYQAYASYLEKEEQPEVSPNEVKKRMEEVNKASDMIKKTVDVAFCDSIVVDKQHFLKQIKHEEGMGYLYSYADYFNKQTEGEYLSVYESERKDKIYYSDYVEEQRTRIFVRYKIYTGWSEPAPVTFMTWSDTLAFNQNYPYLLQDGLTIYFASQGKESIGGYDIFKSYYNDLNGQFFKPENIGMPFNSIYNDYLLAIDENKKRGWLVSDRYQPEGKVIIYSFVLPDMETIVETTDETQLRQKASLSAVAYKTEEGCEKYVEDIRNYSNEELKMNIFIADTLSYTSLSQFKSEEARDAFIAFQDNKKQLEKIEKELNVKRLVYMEMQEDESGQRQILTQHILQLEKQQKSLLNKSGYLLTIVREKEIEALKNEN